MKSGQTREYKEKFSKAVELYNSGTSTNEIGRILKMDFVVLRENLREQGFILSNQNYNPNIKRNIFNKIETEEQAYWLGFLYADGYVSKSENRIELILKDKKHVEKFADFLGLEKERIREKRVKLFEKFFLEYRLSFRNMEIHKNLIEKGCTPKKSLTLSFPKNDIVPVNLLNHFVRGYFDGDGSLGIYNNGREYCLISINGTREFLGNIKNIYNLPNNKYRMDGKAYRYATASQSSVESFLNSLYKNSKVYLDRKYDIFINCRFE